MDDETNLTLARTRRKRSGSQWKINERESREWQARRCHMASEQATVSPWGYIYEIEGFGDVEGAWGRRSFFIDCVLFFILLLF